MEEQSMSESHQQNIDYWPFSVFVLSIICSLVTYVAFELRGSSILSAMGLAIGLGIILGLHILSPKLDPLHAFVSQYSLQSNGRRMRIAFYIIAVASFNLTYILIRLRFGIPLAISIFVAGAFSAAMGLFSQKSGEIDDIKNTTLEGNLHSLSAGISFSSATLSMLIFAISFHKLADFQWLRGTALSLFSVTFMTVLLQIVLGLRKIEVVKSVQKRDNAPSQSTGQIIGKDFQKSKDSLKLFTRGQGQMTPPTITRGELPGLTRTNFKQLVQANKGLGLTERILIFLFLIWSISLSVVTYFSPIPN